ncbi:MAG: endonuclease/exonuclease/phosphatase family protein [Bacteroidota bacterium]
MRILYGLLLLGLIACQTTQSGTTAEQKTAKIMTYNIRLDAPNDKADNWHQRKADMVNYLQKENPDFLGVQEALVQQIHYLDSALTDYAYIGVGRDDGQKEGEFMALFYKKMDWQIVQDSTFWLSATPNQVSRGWDAACHRTTTVGHFKNRHNQEIYVLNTHFDHVGQQARQLSTDLLINHLASLPKAVPAVLIGDFNFTPDNPNYQRLTAAVDDAFHTAAEKKVLSEGTFNGFKMEGTFPRLIDYIFTKTPVDYLEIPMPKTREGRQLSDHFPVIVELKL